MSLEMCRDYLSFRWSGDSGRVLQDYQQHLNATSDLDTSQVESPSEDFGAVAYTPLFRGTILMNLIVLIYA